MNRLRLSLTFIGLLLTACTPQAIPDLPQPTATRLSPTATQVAIATDPAPVPPMTDAAPADAALSSINGWVWHDVCESGQPGQPAPATPPAGCVADEWGSYRANGIQEIGESPLAGVQVRLGAGACPATGLAETISVAGDLSYTFSGLSAGTYCVSIDPTDTVNASYLLPGTWTYPAVDVGSQTVELKAGENKFDVNFGWDYQFLPSTAGGHGDGACTYKAAFIADITVPDNTVFAPGASFIKTWRVRNDGTCAWGKDYALSSLAFVGGDPLGAPEGVALPINVQLGSTADISVLMTAPVTPGIYRSDWKLAGTGLLFGVGANDAPLYVQIVVAESYRATPVADSPAAGICASFEGDQVEVQIYPDLPDPRCVKVRANQKLTLHNQTSKPVEFTLGQFNARIEPGQAYTIDRPLGDYLAPGVHRVLALPYSGPELWLE